jgi:hypothetical protein
MFLVVMVIGLVGLATMAIPAFAWHGAAPPAHGHAGALGHGGAGSHVHAAAGHGGALIAPHASPTAATGRLANENYPNQEILPAAVDSGARILRLLPSPRAVFTVLALYGAFGNVAIDVFHVTSAFAALGAALPALLVERFAVRPLWNLMFRFQGRPSAPLGQLLLSDAVAVVPFRNGRGIVATNREGRMVQLAARMRDEEASLPVKVGDRLRIEEVDAANERVTVSMLRHK